MCETSRFALSLGCFLSLRSQLPPTFGSELIALIRALDDRMFTHHRAASQQWRVKVQAELTNLLGVVDCLCAAFPANSDDDKAQRVRAVRPSLYASALHAPSNRRKSRRRWRAIWRITSRAGGQRASANLLLSYRRASIF